MSTQKHQFVTLGQFLRHTLGKRRSLWSHVYNAHSSLGGEFFCHTLICIIHRLCLHQHARTATVGVIVHPSMLIPTEIPDIHSFNTNLILLYGPSGNAGIQPLHDHFRKKRQNVKIHSSTPYDSNRL